MGIVMIVGSQCVQSFSVPAQPGYSGKGVKRLSL